MNDTIAVVKTAYVLEEAYEMGHSRHTGTASEVADTAEEFDLSPLKGSAQWANNIAPELRSMAGLDDSGHGTYQENRQIAAVVPGCEEDEPAEARLVDAREFFGALVEAFDAGAYDAIEDTYDPDSAQHCW